MQKLQFQLSVKLPVSTSEQLSTAFVKISGTVDIAFITVAELCAVGAAAGE